MSKPINGVGQRNWAFLADYFRRDCPTVAPDALAIVRAVVESAPGLTLTHLRQRVQPVATVDDINILIATARIYVDLRTHPLAKRIFIKAVLDHLKSVGVITQGGFVGAKGRQDYRVVMPDGWTVAIEAKGCGDGNNMGIWDRPQWANEFIIWSLCPESLQHQPGYGIWSAISIRLAPKIIFEQQQVDAFIYYDQRCGSDLRPCPKAYGIHGLRAAATTVERQESPAVVGGGSGTDWMPPPSIYLFPRAAPNATSHPEPPLHTAHTCRFAGALLTAFNVPEALWTEYASRISISAKQNTTGLYRRVALYHGTEERRPQLTLVGY